VELSLALPENETAVPEATVRLAAGAEIEAVTVLRGAGYTVITRVALAAMPVLSLAVKVTVQTKLAVPVLVKVWVAEAPATAPPSPKVQA